MDRKSRQSKYTKKSDQTRSKYLTSPVEQIVREPLPNIVSSRNVLNESQGTVKRIEDKIIKSKQTDLSNISFVKTDTVNNLYNLTTIGAGKSIRDIIISHWSSTSTDAVISLYWSTQPKEDITATVAAGRINSISKGYVVRLLTITIPHSTTMSLKDNGIIDNFSNLSKDIFLYAISSQAYTHWTVIKE